MSSVNNFSYNQITDRFTSGIIGIVTMTLSYICIIIGKKFGDKLSNKAEIIGGLILIAIGLKTFIEYLIEVL